MYPYGLNNQNQDDGDEAHHQDCFLKADSLIMHGMCKAIVVAVGTSSTRGNKSEDMHLDDDTPLQKKLKNLTNKFSFGALITALIIFVLRLVMMFVTVGESLSAGNHIVRGISDSLNYMVVIAVVSIPEGLPLAVGVSLAFSVMKMNKDKLLVRKLDAPEKMGAIEEIICGKSGTITTGNMKVSTIRVQGMEVNNTRKDTLLNCKLTDENLGLIKQSILYNTEARVEMDDTIYVPVGNATEVSLLKFLQDAEIPVHLLIQRKLGRIRAHSPFDPESRRSVIAMTSPEHGEDKVLIYVKGAPETIFGFCTNKIGAEGVEEFTDKDFELAQITKMAQAQQRCMSFAYAQMDLVTFIDTYENGDQESIVKSLNAAIDSGDIPLTLVASFGLRDPLRSKVQSCVKYAREHAMLNVRLVSGDHIDTAKSVAIKTGILQPEEVHADNAIMTGDSFYQEIGQEIDDSIQASQSQDGEVQIELSQETKEKFKRIAQNLRVLARASAHHKYLLVAGLKAAFNRKVSVTGDGINDVEALKLSDVGMVMNDGSVAAKEESSLILTENDFEATLKAVMWGRNIFHNISRFLQFQVTVNVSVLVVIFVGTIVFGRPPLNAVQLLWLNLIMDTFAALSLSTEPPLPQVIKGEPYTDKMSILTLTVRAQIYLVSLWNIIVMMLVMFTGASLDNLNYVSSDDPSSDTPGGHALRKHFTIIYNTFVFLQMFNMINCRKIARRDFNVFEAFFHNGYFLILFVFIAGFQYAQTNWGFFRHISMCEPLDRSEWGSIIAVGSTNLLVSAVIKLLPDTWISKLPLINKGNEDEEFDSKVLNKFNAVQEGRPLNQPGTGGSAVADNEQALLGKDDDFEKV